MPSSIQAAVVVDGDESMRNLIMGYLEPLGVSRRLAFASGTDVWAHLLIDPADLIIMDWRVRGLSGVTLLNKIRRQQRLATVPVLVISGSLGKEDFRLIQEFPGTYFLTKPFQRNTFEEKLKHLFDDQKWTQKNMETIDTVFQFCGKDGDRALSDSLRLLKDAPNPIPFAILFGKRMHAAKFTAQAKTIYKQALEIDGQCVAAMNELARILKEEGKFPEALRYLNKAYKLAPKNIERLCMLGETEISLSHPAKAVSFFQKALAIDKTEKRAQDGLQVLQNVETYLARSPEADTSRSLASMLNNTGIAMVRDGDFTEGLKHYGVTLGLLHQKDVQARVCFNVGIGFLRWSKPQEALGWFVHSVSLDTKGGNKSHRYVAMLKARFASDPAHGPRWTKGEVKALDSIDYSDLDKVDITANDLAADLNGAGLSVEEDPFVEDSIMQDVKKA